MEKAVKASRNAREGRYAGCVLGVHYRTGPIDSDWKEWVFSFLPSNYPATRRWQNKPRNIPKWSVYRYLE